MTSSLLTRPREGRGAPHGGRGVLSLHPPAVGTRVDIYVARDGVQQVQHGRGTRAVGVVGATDGLPVEWAEEA